MFLPRREGELELEQSVVQLILEQVLVVVTVEAIDPEYKVSVGKITGALRFGRLVDIIFLFFKFRSLFLLEVIVNLVLVFIFESRCHRCSQLHFHICIINKKGN